MHKENEVNALVLELYTFKWFVAAVSRSTTLIGLFVIIYTAFSPLSFFTSGFAAVGTAIMDGEFSQGNKQTINSCSQTLSPIFVEAMFQVLEALDFLNRFLQSIKNTKSQ